MNNQIIIDDIKNILSRVKLDCLNGKQVLITGATGLLGTYLLYSIKIHNESVRQPIRTTIVCHCDLPEHLSLLSDEEWLEIVDGDLVDFSVQRKLSNYDVVIHAAGYGQPGKFMDDQMKTLALNTQVTAELLRKVKPKGKFLFISTSEIYSGSSEIPYKECTNGVTMPDHPRACYIEGKRCGEAMCNIYRNTTDIDVKIARVALAYGPGVRKNDARVLYHFIQKALHGNIEMLDEGRAERVYCYVADTVENLWNILLYGKECTYNVGGESHVSIFELAHLIATYFGVEVQKPVAHTNGLDAAPNIVYMDVSKVNQEFNKTMYCNIEEGVKKTIDWYKQYFEGEL